MRTIETLLLVTPVLLCTNLIIPTSTIAAVKPGAKPLDRKPWISPIPLKERTLQTHSISVVAQITTPAISAPEPGSSEDAGSNEMEQVTSVSQLSDVQPTDWAFGALQNLVEKYGVISGYPDGTFRGNRALTRYEFAAGLNIALKRINELMAAGGANRVRKEDVATVKRLAEQFTFELAILRGRVDAQEARTAELEVTQFSTTTKLSGEVIFGLTEAFGDKKAVPSRSTPKANLDENATLSDRVRLNFDTSFSGKDLLRVRLQTSNVPNLAQVTGTNMARLGYEPSGDNANTAIVQKVQYRFPLGKKFIITAAATGGELGEMIDPVNPLLNLSANGSLSRFGRYSPIYRDSGTVGGLVTYNFSPPVSLSVGYLAGNANNASPRNGLFNGGYNAISQLNIHPSNNLHLALTYSHAYGLSPAGGTGSTFANNPFGSTNSVLSVTTNNAYGAEASLRVNKGFTVAGWVDLTKAVSELTQQKATIFNWAVALTFPNLGKKGALGGIIFGQPPRVTDNDIISREDKDTSYHLEGLYRYQLTDNITVTPGVIVIFNPDDNSANNTIYVGTVRTTFSF